MNKPYRITEIFKQIESLLNMNCSIQVIADKATVDVYRLSELSRDKFGFFRKLLGRERPRFIQGKREYNTRVLISFEKIDIPPNMIVFDYLLFAVGRRAAISGFTASKCDVFTHSDRSSTTYDYQVLPIAPNQNPDEINLELPELPKGVMHAWYPAEYNVVDIINLPDGWRAKVYQKRTYRNMFGW